MIRVGVTGWPVAQSRSPVIFAHWFKVHGIVARYEPIPVPPEEAAAFYAALPADLAGVNVTVPHKEVAAAATEPDAVGRRLGAVNTLWRENGAVRSTSSDGAGFIASLDADAPAWREGRRALIVGAGGAAVSVADALVAAGHAVMVANRSMERAEALAARVGAFVQPMEQLGDALGEVDLFVNATSLGMVGKAPLGVDLAPLPAHAVVADIVYNPLHTPLLAAAQARGLTAVDGLGMLLHQATEGFARWFGVRPAVDEALRRKVVATL